MAISLDAKYRWSLRLRRNIWHKSWQLHGLKLFFFWLDFCDAFYRYVLDFFRPTCVNQPSLFYSDLGSFTSVFGKGFFLWLSLHLRLLLILHHNTLLCLFLKCLLAVIYFPPAWAASSLLTQITFSSITILTRFKDIRLLHLFLIEGVLRIKMLLLLHKTFGEYNLTAQNGIFLLIENLLLKGCLHFFVVVVWDN